MAVTGAGSGIGAATAKLLIERGWQVVALDRDPDAARKVVGDRPVISVDVADEAAVVRAFDEVRNILGGLDALAAIAGIYDTTPFFEITAEKYRRIHDVNVIGTFLCMREGAKLMEAGARICTVASVAGLRGGGLAERPPMPAARARSLPSPRTRRACWGRKASPSTPSLPGMIDTPFAAGPLSDASIKQRIEAMTSFNRLGTPEEIAAAIVWLLSPEASYVHGATLVADGGMVMY